VSELVWLERDDALAIHEMMLSQYGGLAGIRDEGLLLSALAKPRHRHAYGSGDPATWAASYAAGIIHNHPFLDGNKRTGFMLAATFLELNEMTFFASEESVVEKTLAFAAGALKEDEYAAWLRIHSSAIKDS
jgi:death-on-curing protein